jgi:hypothetical protein
MSAEHGGHGGGEGIENRHYENGFMALICGLFEACLFIGLAKDKTQEVLSAVIAGETGDGGHH